VTATGWFVLAILVIVPVIVLLEARRQRKRYGRASGAPGLMGAGMLELQKHLQPDRKIEILQKEKDETVEDDAGDGFR
jgi:hypothetical protein